MQPPLSWLIADGEKQTAGGNHAKLVPSLHCLPDVSAAKTKWGGLGKISFRLSLLSNVQLGFQAGVPPGTMELCWRLQRGCSCPSLPQGPCSRAGSWSGCHSSDTRLQSRINLRGMLGQDGEPGGWSALGTRHIPRGELLDLSWVP